MTETPLPACPACHACAEAERNPHAGLCHAECRGCTARSIAGSLVAHGATDADGQRRLYELIDELLPGVPQDEARAMVRAWWRRLRGVGAGETTFTRAGSDG